MHMIFSYDDMGTINGTLKGSNRENVQSIAKHFLYLNNH